MDRYRWIKIERGVGLKGVDVAVRCSVLQCVAVCCSVLQFVAVCCSEREVGLKEVEVRHFS